MGKKKDYKFLGPYKLEKEILTAVKLILIPVLMHPDSFTESTISGALAIEGLPNLSSSRIIFRSPLNNL